MYDDYSTSYTAGSELAVGLFLLFWLVVLVLILILTVSFSKAVIFIFFSKFDKF